MRSYVLFALMLLSGINLSGQVLPSAAIPIDQYCDQIDSLIAMDAPDGGIVRSLIEGTISETTVDSSHNTSAVRTITRTGGFSTTTYSNTKGDTLFKIAYHDNLDSNLYMTFYYRVNKVVYAKIDYTGSDAGSFIYSRAVEFRGKTVVGAWREGDPRSHLFSKGEEVNLFHKANEYAGEYFDRQVGLDG
ncbi:MAG: hypothetical protein EOO88_01220 [Pedobacter sp.]|nr:MAG: hypothetical protein EOO88_01220 [Pedobacter sp.]